MIEMITQVKKSIINRIVYLQKKFHLSARELAEKVDLTHAAIHKIKKGNTTPSLETLLKIKKIFNISVSELIGENNLSNSSCHKEKFLYIHFKEILDLKKKRSRSYSLID